MTSNGITLTPLASTQTLLMLMQSVLLTNVKPNLKISLVLPFSLDKKVTSKFLDALVALRTVSLNTLWVSAINYLKRNYSKKVAFFLFMIKRAIRKKISQIF